MSASWPRVILKEVTSKIGSGATPRGGKDAYKETGVALIRSLNVHDMDFREKNLARIDDEQAARLSIVELQEGDVLLNITGASIARCCVVPKEYLPARVNQHVSIIRPDPERLSPRFLAYLLTAGEYKDQLLHEGLSAGSTRQALTKAQLQGFEVPVPPLAEQGRIVAILDEATQAIDTAERNTQQNQTNTQQLFASCLREAMTGASETRTDRLLGSVCRITSSLVDPKEAEFREQVHVGAGNIVTGSLADLVDLQTAEEEGLKSGKHTFDEGAVLYSKIRPYLRKVARPDFTGLCSADVYPLTPDPAEITRDYLFYLLLSQDFSDYAVSVSARAGMPKVNRSSLFAYSTSLPSVQRQAAITDQLDRVASHTGSLRDTQTKKLAALEVLRQSVLHLAFSGELSADPKVVDRALDEVGV